MEGHAATHLTSPHACVFTQQGATQGGPGHPSLVECGARTLPPKKAELVSMKQEEESSRVHSQINQQLTMLMCGVTHLES